MSGSLTEIRPGVFKVRAYVGTVDGREIVRSKTFPAKNAKEARRLMHAHITAILSDTQEKSVRRGTMDGLIDDWQKSRKVSPTTEYRERSIIARIRQRLGPIPLDDLNGQHVAEFYTWLRSSTFKGHGHHDARPLSESTVHHHYRVLHAILATGEEWDRVDRNASRKTKRPRKPRLRIVTPTSDEVARLIAAAGPTWGTVFAFTAKTGMRRGEVCAARWSDLRDGTLIVSGSVIQIDGKLSDKTTKSGETREVELDQDTQMLLARWRLVLEAAAAELGGKLSTKARLFPNLAVDRTGVAAMKPNTMSQQWQRVCERADVKTRLHSLRHWHASQLIHDGVDVAEVARQLGHRQTSTTVNFYTHAIASDGKISASMSTSLPLHG